MSEQRLKLRATDAEDLAVFSAVLQDAVIPGDEMAYLPDERRFVLVANRFRWEDSDGQGVPGRIYERVHAGLVIDGVRAVKSRGIDPMAKDRILSLLTIEPRDGAIELTFSGGAVIRIEVERILCHLEDVAEPYPTRLRPSHVLDEPDRR
jgi:hypothetical protein